MSTTKRNILFYFCLALTALVASSCNSSKSDKEATQNKKQPVDYIDPIIGAITYGKKSKDAHGFGKTFPGAATPFGLVQLSPDTVSDGDNGSGYSYEHPTMEGFSFTHMSGVGWFGDLGNFLVTPTIGKLQTNRGVAKNPESGYRSRYSHDTETTEAGYYAVTMDDYNVKAELTSAPRAGIIRFTYLNLIVLEFKLI
ncbi:alpha-1,2-mannosidase [Algibacter lectus]|uniref:Alpha-1,2-mannosidase n=1 Tax=Algibacter lectus TaxID=221126 RepID=A0A090W9W1_9FLAO|nr:alpha-1,2-mannosidase [Algibacter lectus]